MDRDEMDLRTRRQFDPGYAEHDRTDGHKYLNRNPKGKGDTTSGFLAKVDIARGTCIEMDNSTLVATTYLDNPDIEQILEKSLVYSMAADKVWLKNKKETKKHPNLTSMFKEYAMPIYSHRSARYNGKDFEEIGFFRYLALFRHSCQPNAHFSYNPSTGRAAIHAIRLIPKGEEVTVSYLPASSYDIHTLPDALQVLKRTFGRTCTCPMHTPEGLAIQASKVNFEIERNSRQLLEAEACSTYEEHMIILFRIVEVYAQYHVADVRIGRVVEEGLACACSYGDLARAVVLAWTAKKLYSKLEGAGGLYSSRIGEMHWHENSEYHKCSTLEKMHFYKNNPQRHYKFRPGGEWATFTTEVPRAFNGDSSAAAWDIYHPGWLWMTGVWATLTPRSEQYKKMTGLDGTFPFAQINGGEDDIVPIDIDARFGRWNEKIPRIV
ncbi:hypothetical protein BKA65DRAFT_71364 [Rhexocercosporidium sp. MPI-PUGE-AT-0058]|nr:hypothetical protein BKA65DRAFT_71364 [Rhexocercosporidium sp. MPI-PUGE-AT-0058]